MRNIYVNGQGESYKYQIVLWDELIPIISPPPEPLFARPPEKHLRLVENPGVANPLEAILHQRPGEAESFPQGWIRALYEEAKRSQQAKEAPEAIEAFINLHPDLVDNRRRAEMLYFCLKNYINLSPEFSEFPFQEKLEEAHKLAVDFMGKLATD